MRKGKGTGKGTGKGKEKERTGKGKNDRWEKDRMKREGRQGEKGRK